MMTTFMTAKLFRRLTMKNERIPRQLREGTLTGIGYSAESKPRPLLFVLGFVIGIFIGVAI